MKVKELISISRPANLLIIGLTMYTTRYAIIYPYMNWNQVSFSESHTYFLMLVISIILITAYGYITNDLADYHSDKINQKLKIDLGNEEKRSYAQNASFLIVITGIFFGFVSAIIAKNWMLMILIFFVAFSVWFYSGQLKKFLFIDNLIVAFLCGLVPLLVAIFDLPSLADYYSDKKMIYYLFGGDKIVGESFYIYLFNLCLTFGIFAFLINLKREIIKDIEDMKGDVQAGYQSIAINFGKTFAFRMSFIIGIILIIFIMYVILSGIIPFVEESRLPIFLLVIFACILLPLVQSMFLDLKENAEKSSRYLKLCMLGGILTVLVLGISHDV